jgi:hypothetical protein
MKKMFEILGDIVGVACIFVGGYAAYVILWAVMG